MSPRTVYFLCIMPRFNSSYLDNRSHILKRAVGHTPKSKTLDEVYLHPKATQMIEAFDKANQLVNDEVLTTTKA